MVEETDRVLETMNRARDMGADLLEWRLDVTRDPEMYTVMQQAPLPLITTVRSTEQGGRFSGSRAEQLNLLLEAAASGSTYVDWEFRADEPLPGELSDMRKRLILSYHNFNETPSSRELESLFDEMAASRPWVVKVVTLATEVENNIALLNLIGRGKSQGINVVSFCLGPLGRISRVACVLMGGAFSYAALEAGAEAAPGQLTVAQMLQLMELLR
jgi:3-dehydroquinate dehydratase type I